MGETGCRSGKFSCGGALGSCGLFNVPVLLRFTGPPRTLCDAALSMAAGGASLRYWRWFAEASPGLSSVAWLRQSLFHFRIFFCV